MFVELIYWSINSVFVVVVVYLWFYLTGAAGRRPSDLNWASVINDALFLTVMSVSSSFSVFGSIILCSSVFSWVSLFLFLSALIF